MFSKVSDNRKTNKRFKQTKHHNSLKIIVQGQIKGPLFKGYDHLLKLDIAKN